MKKRISYLTLSKQPLVSVLMPSYNGGRFLLDSIESILNQSYKNFELIIIEDGSSDNSLEILRSLQKKDMRITIIKNSVNKGIVYSLNVGLKQCRGKYIVRMDADDISFLYRIKKQVEYMENNPEISVSGAKIKYMDAEGNNLGIVLSCQTTKSILTRNPLLHPTVIIRRRVLTEHNLFYQERFRYAEDYFLWIQIYKIGKIGSIPDIVLKYRISSQASRIRHLKDMLKATIRVKLAGIFEINVFPSFRDIFGLFGEMLLLLLPASLVMTIYLKLNFPESTNISL